MTNRVPWLPGYTRENYPAEGQLFGDFLCGLWATACDALQVPLAQAVQTTRNLRAALPSWSRERIGAAPARASYVAEDGFPAEMSVNWSGEQPELRLLFDWLGDNHGLLSLVNKGETRRFDQVKEIFTTHAGRPSTAPLWHAIAWRPPTRLVHKTYFGLYDWPPEQRYAAVREAMTRLDLADAWSHALEHIETGDGAREIEFFAVDQADSAQARVKIYYRNHSASLSEVDRVASVARQHDGEAALAAYRTLTGPRTDAGEAALTCLAFRSGLDQVAESTTYLRLSDLAGTDSEAVDRTAALLRREGVDPQPLYALAEALAPTPLPQSKGLLTLVSYRAAGRRGDVTTYFRFPVYERNAA